MIWRRLTGIAAWQGALWLAATGAEPRLNEPLVSDVRASFGRIAETGCPLGAWSAGLLPYPSYSPYRDHDVGDNHFQGVQRLRAGAFLVVSGSNIGRNGDRTRSGLSASASWDNLAPVRCKK